MLNPPKRSTKEFLDTPGQDPEELWGLLGDIRRTNRRFGGYSLIARYLRQFLPALGSGPLTLVDVATASADVPRAVTTWSRRLRVPVRVVALDLSEDILALARRGLDAYPEIALLRADALALPFADRSVDIVTCGLALHHFTFEAAVGVLREIDRVARAGFVVNDIVRSWSAYAGAWLDTRLLSRNRLARHDGPLSVLRSFTVDEFAAMAHLAGLHGVELHRHRLFRVALVRRPPAPGNKGTRERGNMEPVPSRR